MMATTPPTEQPPFPENPGTPTEPGQPTPLPTELPSPTPDVDFPDPMPLGDPGGAPGQPVDGGMTGDFA